jgi:hypothetical protein
MASIYGTGYPSGSRARGFQSSTEDRNVGAGARMPIFFLLARKSGQNKRKCGKDASRAQCPNCPVLAKGVVEVTGINEYRYFAGGEWRTAENHKLFDVYRPYDRGLYARVAASTGNASDLQRLWRLLAGRLG